jgi:NAD-dependent dihydropyrimidine dehydrogenase PreA subunit
MIEIIDEERCTECNLCVSACPTNVFAASPGGVPVIARRQDCQTCFMCELYCTADALFVSPLAEQNAALDLPSLRASGALGSYRRAVGWADSASDLHKTDRSYILLES